MSTVLKSVVFVASGENSGTYDALCFLENFSGDLNEVTQKFVSHDCDIYISVQKYKVKEIELPDWVDEKLYLLYSTNIKFSAAIVAEASGENFNINTLNRVAFLKLIIMSEKYRYFYGWLNRPKNKDNTFLASLLSQFNVWLNDENPKYGMPLSDKQFLAGSKFCSLLNAAKISNRIYWQKN